MNASLWLAAALAWRSSVTLPIGRPLIRFAIPVLRARTRRHLAPRRAGSLP